MEKKILNYLNQVKSDESLVICSIVHQSGSVPRKDYPIMVVTDSGNTIGTIGGGKLEYNVITTAKSVFLENHPILLHHLMTGKDVLGDSGICGGEVSVLIEPFTSQSHQVFLKAAAMAKTQSLWISTIIRQDESNLSVNWEVQSTFSDFDSIDVDSKDRLLKSFSKRDNNVIEVYRHLPAISRLHIFGAGHVGMALAELAHFLDYSVNVYDDRSALLTEARYPKVENRVVGTISDLLKTIELCPSDAIIVTTRNHAQDMEIMRRLVADKFGYLGLVSSRRKWALIRRALENEGVPTGVLQSIYAPTGLDIGADTVPEIALSIMSEIVHHQKHAKPSKASLILKREGKGLVN